jgi:alkylation response protein AidB-like acyl-CoA dehydrogenase
MSDAIDLTELQDSIRDVLSGECPIERVQRHVLSGLDFDAALWQRVAGLGWLGLGIDAEYGGLGLGQDALAILYAELGRVLAPLPVLPTLLAADTIARFGSPEQKQRWLPAIAAGELRAAVSDPAAAGIEAGISESGFVLNGEARNILDGMCASVLVLKISLQNREAYAVLDANTPGLSRHRFQVTDQTRHLAHVTLAGVAIDPGRLLDQPAAGASAALRRHALLAIANDAVAGGDAILARTLDYLKLRQQFGRVIGSFQALKHRVADHKAGLVGAEGLVLDSSNSVASASPLLDALEAKILATSVYHSVAKDCIQLHGGIGFTWDYPAHLFLKRAMLNIQLFGSLNQNLDEVAMGLAACVPEQTELLK